MSNKLKVDDLRAELRRRGLSIQGTKPILVQRLESALEEEQESMKNATDASAGRKRPRDSTVGGSDFAKKIKATEELQEMGVCELSGKAVLGGSASGELVGKLCAALEKKDPKNEEVEENSNRREKVSGKREDEEVSIEKGSAELDQYLPDDIKSQYHVFEQGGEFYDAMLNQTNVGENNNKFYVIQVLESNDRDQFMVYSRWGRVGIKGQDKLQGPYRSQESAIKEFTTKFFTKTKNNWADRQEFVSYPKYYTWLEMDYSSVNDSKVQDKPSLTMEDQLQMTKLDPRIAKFISLICNTHMMEQQMIALGYNAKKLPLGKLSKSTISKGYDVLRRIADVMDQFDKKMLEQLTGEFYTVIPHDIGFRKMRDCIIDNHYKLMSKLEMVEALGEIEVAASLFKNGIFGKDDPLFSNYRCLQCELTPLEVESAEFSVIKQYIQNTGPDHKVEIIQIFKASRKGERERFKEFAETKNRMLLWHGSRLTNWTGILSQGLRIAPPVAPANGYTFGKGLYFADMFSKSADYCWANSEATDGVLILCEVALGEIHEIRRDNSIFDKLPKGKLSCKAVGRVAPDPIEALILEDGVVVPLGKPQELEELGIVYNSEYVIYNINQIRIRYAVHVKFSYT